LDVLWHKLLAIRAAAILSRDIELLWPPAKLGHVLALGVQEVVLQQLGEDGVVIEGVAALAVGISCARQSAANHGGHGALVEKRTETRHSQHEPRRRCDGIA
jgi:hypothetical protein